MKPRHTIRGAALVLAVIAASAFARGARADEMNACKDERISCTTRCTSGPSHRERACKKVCIEQLKMCVPSGNGGESEAAIRRAARSRTAGIASERDGERS